MISLTNADETRNYMESVQRDVAAFIDAEGNHVLVEIDGDDDIALVDPTNRRSWAYLERMTDCWPLVPLATEAHAGFDRLRIAAQDAAAILRVDRPLTKEDARRAAGILSGELSVRAARGKGDAASNDRRTLGGPADAAAEIIARAMHARTPAYYHSGMSWPLDGWHRERDMEVARGVLKRVLEALTPTHYPGAPELETVSAEWCIDCPDCYNRGTHRVNAPCGKVHDCPECATGRTIGASDD